MKRRHKDSLLEILTYLTVMAAIGAGALAVLYVRDLVVRHMVQPWERTEEPQP